MLEGVVEGEDAADLPVALVESDAVAAARRHDQRQVDDDPRVGLAVVRRDAGARRERGEHGVRAGTGEMHGIDELERLGGARAACEVLLHRLAAAVEMEAGPRA